MSSTPHYSSKSYTHSFTKSFIVCLVLVLLPFIPSQPPDFIKETIFKSFWELIYLFVIGILVCYGLFSRRNVKLETVSYSTSEISASYFSGISHVSSFFENGVRNPYEYDEKKMTQKWNFGERFDFDEFKDSTSSKLQNGAGNPNGIDEKDVAQYWNSKCFIGESVVFVANDDVKPKSRNGYKPLNLPVRSLKSRIVDTASNYEDKNECGLSSNLKAYDDIGKINKVNFRGLAPINLDDKFRETVVSSPVRWVSRSERMDLRENVGNVNPPFVSETESVCPESPARSPIPIITTVSQPVLTSEMEEFETKKSLQVYFPSASKSSLARLKSKTSPSRSSSLRFSTEVAVEKITEYNLKGFGKGKMEDLLSRKTKGVVSLKSDVKLATLVNERSTSGSFSDVTREKNSKNDFKGLTKGRKEDSLCGQNKCIESSNPDTRNARLVEGQLQIGLSSEMTYEKSCENNLKGFDRSEKGDLLERVNNGKDFWNLDMNTASLVKGRFSIVSSSEINVEKNSETVSMGIRKNKKEDLLSGENKGIDSLKPYVKSGTTVKGLTRGKSVRTLRSNEIHVGLKRSEEVYSSHIGDKTIKNCDEDEAGLLKNSDRRAGLESVADERCNRKNLDKLSDTKNLQVRKNRNGKRQKSGSSALVKSESIFKESENFQVTADEEKIRPYIFGDTQSESDEVDKKAAAFIAKFREQIRLQKVASMGESRH